MAQRPLLPREQHSQYPLTKHSLPITHTRRPAVPLREERLGVGEEQLDSSQNLNSCPRKECCESTHDVIVLNAIDLAPCIHDPAVVARNDGHNIDAFGLELANLLNIRRKVTSLAPGSECT